MKLASILRFACVVLVLGSTAGLLHARGGDEHVPAGLPVTSFPTQLGAWQGRDIPIDPKVREVLGNGDFMERFFTQPGTPPADVFIAYFPTQRTGDTIHSPKNCLPGAGWVPLSSDVIHFQGGNRTFEANRVVIAKGQQKQLTIYWYEAHGRSVASEYWAKFYLVADSIRMHRSDGALVRLMTPISQFENESQAEERLMSVAGKFTGDLENYIPR